MMYVSFGKQLFLQIIKSIHKITQIPAERLPEIYQTIKY